MKVILIITLFALSLCTDIVDIDGDWEKCSLEENNTKIEEAYHIAYEKYATNINVKIDDLIHLTAYYQIVNGTNYRIAFIDRKSEFPTIHEFQFYNPLPVNNNGTDELIFSEHIEYDASEGLLDFNDEDFTLIENKLYYYLKKQNEKLNYIMYAYPVECQDYTFFIIYADTENGQSLYVIGRDPESQEFDVFQKIK